MRPDDAYENARHSACARAHNSQRSTHRERKRRGVKETGTARQSARSLVREQEKGGRREGGGAGGGEGEMKRGVNHGHQGEGAV